MLESQNKTVVTIVVRSVPNKAKRRIVPKFLKKYLLGILIALSNKMKGKRMIRNIV